MVDMEYFHKQILNRAKSDYCADYNKTIEQMLDFYFGRQFQDKDGNWYLSRNEGESNAAWRDRQKHLEAANVTRMIINKLGSNPYRIRPERTVRLLDKDGKDTDKDLPEFEHLRTLWKDASFNAHMIQVNRFRKLLGEYWVNIQWYDPVEANKEKLSNDSTSHKEKVELETFPPGETEGKTNVKFYSPDQVYPITDEEDAERVNGVVVSKGLPETWGRKNSNRLIEQVYSNVHWSKYISGKHVDGGENPYKFLPWIQVKSDTEDGATRGRGVGHEIVSSNKQGNYKLTHLGHLVRVQTHGQPVFWEVAGSKIKGVFGSLVPIFLKDYSDRAGGARQDFQYVSPDADIEKVIAGIEVFFNALFATFGLRNKNPFRLDVSNPESGIAKWIEESEVMEDFEQQSSEMADYEREIAFKYMKIDGYHRNGSWSDALDDPGLVDVQIIFKKPPKPLNENEQLMRDESDINKGVKTVVDIRMDRHPEEDRETARQSVLKNRVETAVMEIEEEDQREKEFKALGIKEDVKPPPPVQDDQEEDETEEN